MSVRLSSDTVGSTALQTLNAAVSPTPLVPASQAALSTLTSVGSVNLRGTDILDSVTMNALISQQSATNRTLDALSQRALGIVPGTVGCTVTQLSGTMLKPGLQEIVQSKLDMGLPFQQCVSNNLLSGVGARTVDGLINNANAQIAAVTNSITSSVNGLINRGIITGSEPATQISGIALGASNFGIDKVSGAISNLGSNISGSIANIGSNINGSITNIGSNISGSIANIGSNISGALGNITTNITDKLSGLSNMISSGNFASGLADKFTSGLANNISGALTGAVAGAVGALAGKLFGKGKSSVTVEQLQQQQLPAARKAYLEAEAALVGTMKPNEANYLSDAVPQQEISEAERVATTIKNAELDLESADSDAIAARIAYNENPSAENRAALSLAENALARAKQQVAAVASDIISPQPKKRGGFFGGLKNSLSEITGAINGVTDSIKSTVQQGVNIYNNVTKAATLLSTAYATGGLSLLANSKLAQSIGSLTNPTKLAGDLVGKFNASLGGLADPAGKLGGLIAGGEAKLKSLLGGLGGTKGVQAAKYASNTDKNSAAIASNTGQLLGSPLVPPPPTVTGETVTDLAPNDYVRAQAAAIQTLENLEAQREIAQLKIERLYEQLGNSTNSAILAQIQSARNTLSGIDTQIARAQIVYENTIRGA